MKKVLLTFGIIVFVLLACAPISSAQPPMYTPYTTEQVATHIAGTISVRETNTALSKSTLTSVPPSFTNTPPISTPTFISATLPNDFTVSYVVEDELWVWKQNNMQLLVQQQNISTPRLSDDGQWILFRQRKITKDGASFSDELWVVRANGSELTHLVGSEDLMGIIGKKVFIDYFDWLPSSHKILFNNEEIIEGPPGSRPLFDLYAVDLAGRITQLLEPGDAGRFSPSPDGVHIALVTDTRIKVFSLKSGTQRTLLEFKPVGFPSDRGPATPKVVWDSRGQFMMASILPENVYYPEKYAGETTQIWRLFINGKVELVADVQLVAPFTGIVYSPDFQYFVYLSNSCIDGMGMITVHSLSSATETTLSCVWEMPMWMPDSKHLIYEMDWLWRVGSIADNTNQPLDVLNVPTDPSISSFPPLTWINNEYFLLTLRNNLECTLNVATLQSVVTEIASVPPGLCPWGVDFSLPE